MVQSPHTLHHGDIIELLPTLQPAQFDCIIADPPYGMGADGFGTAAKVAHRYEDDPTTAINLARAILCEGYRVAKPQCHLYLFCDIEQFLELRDLAEQCGWTPWRTPIIWSKGTTGHIPQGPYGLRRTYETILLAIKGHMDFGRTYPDLVSITNLRDREHAAQKPVDLYEELLKRSCIPGNKVLDPCCGSGTIFEAAQRANVQATGVELDDDYYKLALTALSRLQQEQPD